MLLPAEIKQVTIGVHKFYQDRLIKDLHEAGIMEIRNIRDSESDVSEILKEGYRSPELSKYAEYILKINTILEYLEEVREDSPGILRELFSPAVSLKNPVLRRDEHAQLFREAEVLLGEAGDAIRIKDDLSLIRERSAYISEQQESLTLLLPFDFETDYLGESEYLYIVAVQVDPASYEYLADQIERQLGDEVALIKEMVDTQYVTIIATLRDNRNTLDNLLKNPLFILVETENLKENSVNSKENSVNSKENSPNSPNFGGKPSEIIALLSGELNNLKECQTRLNGELAVIDKKWGAKLTTLREELEIGKEQLNVLSAFGRTNDAVIIEGWIAAGDVDTLETLCEETTDGHVFYEFKKPSSNPDGVPVKYDNPPWLQPFEFLTSMFSRPKYDEVDPTLFIGPILIVYFGLMLGDAVYGLVILIMAYLLYRGAGRVSKSVHDLSIILMGAGGATIVFGVMQGGYMGDFLPRFMGITPPFIVFSPLDDPISFLQIALVIGIIQINLGIIVAIYQNLRRKNYYDIIYGQIPWFFIQPSAAILLFLFFGWADPGSSVTIAACVGVIIGVGMLFRKEGPLGFFSLTGFLGDWLSYARLLALALATGGIAMTVNILTEMVSGVHPAAFILAVFIFIGGQIFNFALQSLGAFVHSLRLQFVEFFGQFYVGGGREFMPFSAGRVVTELVEEDR
ncbi:MAG: V-type ATP synthase subunit I [Euryarchaeota archaeon]|nr:V-type ATP synthase subunit I [Euryarchaeota archaeon]